MEKTGLEKPFLEKIGLGKNEIGKNMSKLCHIKVVVTFLVVKFFGFLAIARRETS